MRNKQNIAEIDFRTDGQPVAYRRKENVIKGNLGSREKIVAQTKWQSLIVQTE